MSFLLLLRVSPCRRNQGMKLTVYVWNEKMMMEHE
jgi:hypothetical protein